MEGGAVGPASQDDGGEAAACGVQAGAAAPGHREEGPGGGCQGRAIEPLEHSDFIFQIKSPPCGSPLLSLSAVLNYFCSSKMSVKVWENCRHG